MLQFCMYTICCSEDKIIALYKQLSGLGRGYAIVKYVLLLLFSALNLLNYVICFFFIFKSMHFVSCVSEIIFCIVIFMTAVFALRLIV